jgi:hypothetical protein
LDDEIPEQSGKHALTYYRRDERRVNNDTCNAYVPEREGVSRSLRVHNQRPSIRPGNRLDNASIYQMPAACFHQHLRAIWAIRDRAASVAEARKHVRQRPLGDGFRAIDNDSRSPEPQHKLRRMNQPHSSLKLHLQADRSENAMKSSDILRATHHLSLCIEKMNPIRIIRFGL